MQRQDRKRRATRASANTPRPRKATRVDEIIVGPGFTPRDPDAIDWKTGLAIEDVATKRAIHGFVPSVELLPGSMARVSWTGFPAGVSGQAMRVLLELEWSDNSRTQPFPWIEQPAAGLRTFLLELPWEKRDEAGHTEPDRLVGLRMVVSCPELLKGNELRTRAVGLTRMEDCAVLLTR